MMAAVSNGFERFAVDMVVCFVVGVKVSLLRHMAQNQFVSFLNLHFLQ